MSSSYFLSKQLEALGPTPKSEEPKGWWDSIPELNALEAVEEKRGIGRSCSCHCEGVAEASFMICSEHPPEGIKHMRGIVRQVMLDYYELGRKDALREVRDFILGSAWDKTLEQKQEEK